MQMSKLCCRSIRIKYIDPAIVHDYTHHTCQQVWYVLS